jgi:hypothetical protein
VLSGGGGRGGGRINLYLFLTWTIWFGIFDTWKGFLWKKALIRQISRTGSRGSQNMKGGPIWQVSPWQQQGINSVWTEKGGAVERWRYSMPPKKPRGLKYSPSPWHTHTHTRMMWVVSTQRINRDRVHNVPGTNQWWSAESVSLSLYIVISWNPSDSSNLITLTTYLQCLFLRNFCL